jgi:protein-disulfide isomerase
MAKFNREQVATLLNKFINLYDIRHVGDSKNRFAFCVRDNYRALLDLYNKNTEGAEAVRQFQAEMQVLTADKEIEVPAKTELVEPTFIQKLKGKKPFMKEIEPARKEVVKVTPEQSRAIYEDLLEKRPVVKAYMTEEFEYNIKHCDKQFMPPMNAKQLQDSEFLFNPVKSDIILPQHNIITK